MEPKQNPNQIAWLNALDQAAAMASLPRQETLMVMNASRALRQWIEEKLKAEAEKPVAPENADKN